MPRTALIFGGGLDRETGAMAMQPGGMEDVRNVHALQGKFQVRRGFERVLTFNDGTDEQTDVLGGVAMRGRRAAVHVTYDSVNYKVNVFIGDATGTWASFLAEWPFKKEDNSDILSATNADPPVIILAEYNNLVFLAHSVNDVNARAQTHYVYWDESAGEYKLGAMFNRWRDSGAVLQDMKTRFRGVTKHLDYLVGWGWGTTEEDRPELVRVSEPGVPLSGLQNGSAFNHYHYWIPGDEGDPVITCQPAAETLLCFKESETWELYGDSFLDFGQRRINARYGMLEPRLAVNIEGSVFAWTNEGPREFGPTGTSRGLEIPLELTLPEPYDLPDQGDDKYAFAVYMPIYRSVWFVFGRRVYACYIRVPGDWKWVYQTLGREMMSGFRLPQAGWGLATQPTGYPSSPTMNDIADTTADVVVTNNDQDGDETLEVWLKPGGGSWELHQSFQVTGSATQEHTLLSLAPGWDYDLACRYRRGSYYTPGYESSDPDQWPSTCKTSFTTTLASLPSLLSGVWSRTSGTVEQILLGMTSPYTGTGYDIEIRRNSTLVHTITDVVGGTNNWADTGLTGEDDNAYDIRLVTPYVNGAYTTPVLHVWGGPFGPTIQTVVCDTDDEYDVTWTNGMSAQTEVYDSLPSELEADVMDNLRLTEAAGQTLGLVGVGAGNDGKYPWVGVRHKVTAFSVSDYSELSKMQAPDPIQ